MTLKRDFSTGGQTAADSREVVMRLNALIQAMVQLHPGFPDLYEPLLEALKVSLHYSGFNIRIRHGSTLLKLFTETEFEINRIYVYIFLILSVHVFHISG